MHGGLKDCSLPAIKENVCSHDFGNVSEAFGHVHLSLSSTDSDPDSLPVDRNASVLAHKRLQLVLCCVAVAVLVCAF